MDSDPLDVWRNTFTRIVPDDGQCQLWLGAETLVEEATLAEIEQQAHTLAKTRKEQGQ